MSEFQPNDKVTWSIPSDAERYFPELGKGPFQVVSVRPADQVLARLMRHFQWVKVRLPDGSEREFSGAWFVPENQ